MNIAIIDADLVGRKKHRFPNLVCMKLSAYHKELGDYVELKTDYLGLQKYDHVYLSKVFTDTPVPDSILSLSNLSYGGTGFYYDKAPPLQPEIEHHMPDYHLYDDWVSQQIASGKKPTKFSYYKDYSIGFLTRGCFRKCAFCVNKNYNRVQRHSPLEEFFDPSRPKICLLDDNFLGCPAWKEMLAELQATNRPFQFRQGLDERLLTDEKCEMLFNSRYDGDYIFAFDNIADAKLIESKILLARKYTDKVLKFYCFTGFDRDDIWDKAFWKQDILDLMIRVEILMRNRCAPYVMRFARYEESPYRGFYITVARWCNQLSLYKKKTLREFSLMNGNKSSLRYIQETESKIPEVSKFLDMRFPQRS